MVRSATASSRIRLHLAERVRNSLANSRGSLHTRLAGQQLVLDLNRKARPELHWVIREDSGSFSYSAHEDKTPTQFIYSGIERQTISAGSPQRASRPPLFGIASVIWFT